MHDQDSPSAPLGDPARRGDDPASVAGPGTGCARWVAVIAALTMVAAACGSSGRSGGDRRVAGDHPALDVVELRHAGQPLRPRHRLGHASRRACRASPTDTITIGYGDDAGYQGSPGLDHEMSDAVKAMIDWCNQQGGIQGRKITGQLLRRQDHRREQRDDRGLQAGVHAGRARASPSTAPVSRPGSAAGCPRSPATPRTPRSRTGPMMFQPEPVAPGHEQHRHRLPGGGRLPRPGEEGGGRLRRLRHHPGDPRQGQGLLRRQPAGSSWTATSPTRSRGRSTGSPSCSA